jgi:hypothetical protein
MNYLIGVIAEVRNEFPIEPQTFPLAYALWDRILRGLAPGDPFPSLSDFRRIAEHEAAEQDRPNLYTLARVLMSVETVLGTNARVRRAPMVSNRIEAIDLTGLDPAFVRLFIGLHFNKLMCQAQVEENTTDLRSIEIIDEVGPVGSSELEWRRKADSLSSVIRFSTTSRFTGTGLLCGIQNLASLDPRLKNAPTIVSYRAPSVDDAEDAVKMLGLPRDATSELLRLGVGDCWIRAAGWLRPLKAHIEPFKP